MHLPFYIPGGFIVITIITFILFIRASGYSRVVLFISLGWLLIQAIISLTGFYTFTGGTPPRLVLLAMPPFLMILFLFISRSGKNLINKFDPALLTLLHVIRIAIELILYALFTYKVIPKAITFEGNNFDIISGLTAPLIFYFGYVKKKLNWKLLIAWNILCIILLVNVVTTAILAVPTAFQQIAFDQPNIAILYFPFVWLPCFIVPVVLLSHLILIRKIIAEQRIDSGYRMEV